MALSGSGGAYYRAGSLIPVGEALSDANTMHCLVRSTVAPGTTNFRGVMSFVGSSENPHEQHYWNHSTGSFYKARGHRDQFGAYVSAQLSSSPSTNTWYALTSSFDGTNARVYLGGALEATSAGSSRSLYTSDIYLDVLALMTYAGALDSSSQFAEGIVAEVGLWNVALSADEIAALGKGFRPPRIRPQNLKAYYPGVGNLVDVVGGRTLVKQAGTDTFADHPRVF